MKYMEALFTMSRWLVSSPGVRLSLIPFVLLGTLVMNQESFAQITPSLEESSVYDSDGLPHSSDESSYRIGPQDVLQISVWKDEILSREVVVRPDGFISFPLIGEVKAVDRPVGDLAKEMDERLSKFVSDPRISIVIAQVNSFKIFVIGKVNRPGEFQLGQYTDVMQALSLAGGLTPFAREGSIKVLRRVNGKQTTSEFDYSDVLKGKNLEQNIILQRGDIVMVP